MVNNFKFLIYIILQKLYRVVIELFVRLYDDEFIYRSVRFVNWLCVLNFVIFDIEVNMYNNYFKVNFKLYLK